MKRHPKKVWVISRRSTNHAVNFSDLPDDVLFTLLARLPIPEVARTSIVSLQWQRKWEFISDLSFTTTRPSSDPSVAAARLVSAVIAILTHVLSNKLDVFAYRNPLSPRRPLLRCHPPLTPSLRSQVPPPPLSFADPKSREVLALSLRRVKVRHISFVVDPVVLSQTHGIVTTSI